MIDLLVAAAIAAVLALVLFAMARRTRVTLPGNRAAFEARSVPISDAEFLARCTPGTSPEVALKVRRMVADRLAVRYELIHPSTQFVEVLGAD